MVFHRVVQKQSHFQAYCESWRKNIPLALQKTKKLEDFLLITRRKKTFLVINTQYIQPLGVESIIFEKLKGRGMSWTGKTETFPLVLVRMGFAPLA